MTEWKTYKLEDIIDKVIDNRGKSAPTSDEKYSPIIEINSIGDRNPNYDVVRKWVSKDTYDTWFRSGHPMIGDILIPTVGTIGIVSMMRENKGCIAQNIVALRTNEKAHNLYLYYLLKSEYVKQELLNLNIGGVQPSIKVPHLLNLEISLPGLEEQRRIAGILGAIDDKIENNRRINTNLELQAQALYKQWFVDFDFPNEEGKPYKSSGGKMVDSELGPIPEEWRVGDIYKYVNVVYGAPYKSVLFNERKDGNPLIRIRDLKTFSPQYYTQEILPNTEFINTGDVVAGMDAEFVPCLWMGEKGVLNQRCCKFVGKQDSISNYYVMFLVKPELEFVQSYKTGTTVSHLGKADIDKFVVVQPPFAVIEKFSKIADALLNNKIKLAKENITLATLRDTLLPKLMNGEIITK
ncbi:MAG: restriction endonuclease subunit S [Alistipes sp.]|nr:restriction endonuclease subunit S [Alistipes sp.]